MNCGTVNGGAFTCTPKVPKSNGIEIGTTVTEVTNSNGTKTETKTDVAKVTNCAGYNSCTTTQTTNKTVVIKDGSGNTQSKVALVRAPPAPLELTLTAMVTVLVTVRVTVAQKMKRAIMYPGQKPRNLKARHLRADHSEIYKPRQGFAPGVWLVWYLDAIRW